MNRVIVQDILRHYKVNFEHISKKEIYKWKAVKCFQDNWNIGAIDFYEMLNQAFKEVNNLMDSGNYFPKRMLMFYAEHRPQQLKNLFVELFDEQFYYADRIVNFIAGIKRIHEGLKGVDFPYKNTFQDHRAVMVYLVLRFPDTYFLYKFEMFKKFGEMVEFPNTCKKGEVSNLIQYTAVCEMLRDEILLDGELIEMHIGRLGKADYFDSSFNILTQDVIYAAVTHLKLLPNNSTAVLDEQILTIVNINIEVSNSEPIVLNGLRVDHEAMQKTQKAIGTMGEIIVLRYEQSKLKKMNINGTATWDAKELGDGLGYDIGSWNEDGQKIYIEVKATTGPHNTPFYLTYKELECSKIHGDNFFLYRLFELDKKSETAKCFIVQGDLSPFANFPILYRISANKQ